MRLNRTRLVLEESQAVIASRQPGQGVVANYLTEYILIIFYSEVEENLKIIIGNKLKSSSNAEIANFITSKLESILNRVEKKELCKTLLYFGEEKKRAFIAEVDESTMTKYKGFIANRHNVAHVNKTVETSWLDVQSIADIGESVLGAFQEALEEVPLAV